MTVRLYEDIDGCLNASYNDKSWNNGRSARGQVSPRYNDSGVLSERLQSSYSMEWNEELIEELNSLDVDPVWLTTWREDAKAVGSLMGWGQDARVLHPLNGLTTFPSIEWKYETIVDELQRDPTPAIWVDDEIAFLTPSERETLLQLGILIIAPTASLGITPLHIDQMRMYIKEN